MNDLHAAYRGSSVGCQAHGCGSAVLSSALDSDIVLFADALRLSAQDGERGNTIYTVFGSMTKQSAGSESRTTMTNLMRLCLRRGRGTREGHLAALSRASSSWTLEVSICPLPRHAFDGEA